MKVQAYSYDRVSSKGQIPGHGFQRQDDKIQTWADRNGYEIVDSFRDAWTGTDENRPDFMKMLSKLIANGVKTVLVESQSRFARDLEVQINLMALLVSHDITLIFCDTGMEITRNTIQNPIIKAVVNILGAVYELHKDIIVDRMRCAREAKKAATGRCEGDKPYGTKPGEKAVVLRIQALKRTGKNYSAIARILNEDGVKSRYGGRWYCGTVRNVVRRVS